MMLISADYTEAQNSFQLGLKLVLGSPIFKRIYATLHFQLAKRAHTDNPFTAQLTMVSIDSSPAGPRHKVTTPFYLPSSDPRSKEGDFSSYSHKSHERKSGQGGEKSNRRVGGAR